MKDKVIAIMLLIIMCLNFIDVLTDISLGVPLDHILLESLIVIASGIGAIFLIKNMYELTSDIATLKQALLISDDKFRNISEEMIAMSTVPLFTANLNNGHLRPVSKKSRCYY